MRGEGGEARQPPAVIRSRESPENLNCASGKWLRGGRFRFWGFGKGRFREWSISGNRVSGIIKSICPYKPVNVCVPGTHTLAESKRYFQHPTGPRDLIRLRALEDAPDVRTDVSARCSRASAMGTHRDNLGGERSSA